tara:strand:- start:42 stop:665 length:624 start_codon:yes stop_codon:yes gene_type:complete
MEMSYAYLGGFVVMGVIFWLYLTYVKDPGTKQFRTPLYLFTKRRQVYRINAENRGGLMLPDKGGGFVETEGTALIRRWGRVWKIWTDLSGVESARAREVIYVVRENDPTPMNMSYGVENGYQGKQIEEARYKELSNLNQRQAAAQAKMEGAGRDAVVGRLMIGVIVSIVIAGAAWATFFVLTIIQGPIDPPAVEMLPAVIETVVPID